jgi:hypothetical protein
MPEYAEMVEFMACLQAMMDVGDKQSTSYGTFIKLSTGEIVRVEYAITDTPNGKKRTLVRKATAAHLEEFENHRRRQGEKRQSH